MRVILDCKKLSRRQPAHKHLQEALDFPKYYGKNLDALFDCLTDLCDCTIVLRGKDQLVQGDGYGARILQVLEDAAQVNPGLTLETEDWEDE